MQWDAILRDSLRPAAPYVVWLGIVLATSILIAIIREPLCRVLREARDRLQILRLRLLSRSSLSLGRRLQRFWLVRQFEPARTLTGSLDRVAAALPYAGARSLARVAVLEAELRKQVGMLEALGMHPPSSLSTMASDDPTPIIRGSWAKLLMLIAIAGLTGAANSFLLNEFFQGVITSDALFPTTFPDLHVSHIFAVLIFTMEVAIGFALHHFAADPDDGSAARRLLAIAPWLVLVGLLWLEGWAYALLSYQIDIPERLGLPATSGLYSFARYFLALFGAGLTLLLASLGYLLGQEVEAIQAGSVARRQRRFLDPSGWAFHQRAEQIDRAERALGRLKAALANFQLDLAHQFKRAIDATGSSEELATAVRDAITSALESARRVDGAVGRKLDLLELRNQQPIRTRTQAVAEMSFYSAALLALLAVSWTSAHYLAAFVREIQAGRQSGELLALITGTVMVGFGLSSGYVAARAWGSYRLRSVTDLPASTTGRFLLRVLGLIAFLASIGGFTAVAAANRTLGPSITLNLLFGFLHAGVLAALGAVADTALVNSIHTLQLWGLYLERCLVGLLSLAIATLQAVSTVLDWMVRLAAVFGQLVVRPRPPVRVGVAQAPGRSGLPRDLRSPARRFSDRAYGRSSSTEHA